MKVQLEYLTNVLLRSFGVSNLRSDKPVLDLNRIGFLSDGSTFVPGCLYLGNISQLPNAPPQTTEPLTFLCVQDKPPSERYLEQQNIVLLLCPSGTNLQALYNQVSLLFSSTLQSLDQLYVFLSKIAGSSNFTELMTCISSILNCSTAILSQGFKLLGYAQCQTVKPSQPWTAMLRRRYFPYTDIATQLQPQSLTFFDPDLRKIVEDIDAIPESGGAFYPLLSEDTCKEVLGFLYFSYDDRAALFAKRQMIQLIAYALSFRMWRYMNSPSNSNASLCFLMRDIISGALIDDEEIAKRLQNIRFNTSKTTFLVVVYSSAMEKGQPHSWKHLRTVFGQLWPDDVLFTYNGDIVLLISSCQNTAIPSERTEALTAALREHGCFAGISDCFDVIDRSLHNYYVRTLAAAKMAKNFNLKKRYTFYNDIALQHFILEGATIENPRNLCNPHILRLASYDYTHSSNYIYTLQCYWHFNQNIQQTCDHLFIHRNTLFYRLKKIREIVDMDINNPKYLIQFNLSFSILTALGDIPYSEFSEEPMESSGDV